LCLAVGNFVIDRTEATGNHQDYFVSFVDVTTRFNVRELTTAKIGELVRISGQVIRTHPIHPELVAGHFTCQDCQTDVPSVEQQFKVSHYIVLHYGYTPDHGRTESRHTTILFSNARRFIFEFANACFVI